MSALTPIYRGLIRELLLDFDWHNYGLNDVSDAQSDEWADALAKKIQENLFQET